MINDYENGAFEIFWSSKTIPLGLNHKHLPEMKYILKNKQSPIFTPNVGNFKQGMLVMSYIEKEYEKSNKPWKSL